MKLSRSFRPQPKVSLLFFVLMALLQTGCKGSAKPQAPPPPEVSVIRVAPSPITVYDEYVAQTEAPDTIEIRSQVTGLLERQAFEDGARVARGTLLYVIDQRPFQTALAQAKASLAQAEANDLNANQQLERVSRLIDDKAVSQQDYDAAVAAQRAAVREAELNLGYTTLRAPREGYMSKSQVRPGTLVTAQQTLLTTLYSSSPMYVYFAITEDKLANLQRQLKSAAPGSGPSSGFKITLCPRFALT